MLTTDMKTLTIGGKTYQIYDEIAREAVNALDKSAAKIGEEQIDSTAAYTKIVPEDVAPYAVIHEIGGVARKCNQLWDEEWALGYYDNSQGGAFISYTNRLACKNKIKVLPNTKYYISATDTVDICFYNSDEEYIENSGYDSSRHFTTPSDCAFITFNLWITYGTSYKNDIMLNLGSTALPYEPYFEGFRSAPVTAVESVGVNLAPFVNQEFTLNGVTFKCRNGTLILNGTVTGETSSLNEIYKNNFEFVLPAGTYTVISRVASCSCYIRKTSDDTQVVIFSRDSGAVSFILNEQTELYFGFYMYEQTFNNEDLQIMLCRGGTALPYTPYQRHTLTIPAEVQALDGYGLGISETCYNYINFEKKQFVQKVKKVIFDGVTEGAKMDSTDPQSNKTTYYAYILGMDPAYNIPSIVNDPNVSVGTTTVISLSLSAELLGLGATPEAYEITTAVNKYLNDKFLEGNPVTVVYQVTNPIITDITALISTDNIIPVEVGGTITMVNEYGYDVPSTVSFCTGNNEIIGADVFVGDLVGTAERAEVAMDVPAWAKQPSKPSYTASEVGAAPAGFGLGNPISLYATTESQLHEFVDNIINNNNPQAGACYFSMFGVEGSFICYGTLTIGYNKDCILEGILYSSAGTKCRVVKENGVWQSLEWVNPPMGVGAEYRTTERINGKAVYKKKDSTTGKIQYRLDGETTWNDYAPVYGAAPTNHSHTIANVDGLQSQLDGKLKRGSYERIEGTSSAKKDLNDYTTAGFYNVKTANVNNCPSGIGIDAVLLVYAWDSSGYECQEITETAASTYARRWIRHKTGSSWTAWKAIISEDNIGSQSVANADTISYMGITAAPTGEGSYPISITTAFKIGDVTFPTYAKGMFVSTGTSDASMYVIDANGNTYTAFRNGGIWKNAKMLQASSLGKVQTVTYTGTGTTAMPTLTFDFQPKLILIMRSNAGKQTGDQNATFPIATKVGHAVYGSSVLIEGSTDDSDIISLSWSGNTVTLSVSISSTSNYYWDDYFNASPIEYTCIAIG